MQIIERQFKTQKAATAPNNSWFQAMEQSAAADRADDMLGDTFLDFTFNHRTDIGKELTTISYEVPLVWPIRGSAL